MKSVQKNTSRIILVAILAAFGLFLATNLTSAKRSSVKTSKALVKSQGQQNSVGKKYYPQMRNVISLPPVNVRELAAQEALEPQNVPAAEVKSLDPPKGDPPTHHGPSIQLPAKVHDPNAIPPSPTGISPGPTKTFKATESLVAVIPPDTDGAVGTTHIVSSSNDRLRIQDRNGTILSTVTTNSFWSSLVLEGGATPSISDPRVRYDRFNNRFIFVIISNPQTLASATLIAVTATNDPTGTWFRYAIDCDPTATAAGGMWADFPSVGFNKDWIVIQNNLFGFGSLGTGYQGPQIYAIDKAAIYAGPGALGTVPTFFDSVANCTGPVFEPQLGCGFTMSPSITEDNTTPNVYLVEDWDTQNAQLRISKVTGPVGAPVLTAGIQEPQSLNSWRFNATRIGTTGGYTPQKDTATFTVSTTARMMANDSRMQNVVYRGGSLWCAHHVMIATTPTPAGTAVGGTGNPDNHTAIQWWQIDPSIEAPLDTITGLGTPPIQRARIEDPTADNCHNGANGLVATPPCSGSAANQHGAFLTFPSISVNQNNDVLIGFSQFSGLTYPSGAYAIRRSTDPLNTMRDPVVFRPGQSRDNLGGGSGAARQNRWGDYSMSQTDPLNDTDFWTTQEYTGAYRDFGIGIACPWETWWAQVSPSTAAPSLTGNLIISEFRLRGPQGVNDEFVEAYNPGNVPIMVSTADNSDGWTLAYSTTAGVVSGIAVIPNGTVIPARGHFLFARNIDSAIGAAAAYSLGTYPGNTNPSTTVRGSDSDTGYMLDLADNGGLALFKTSTVANFTAPNRMDSVGFASTPAGLFKEGTGIPDVSIAGAQQTFFRNLASGSPTDTDNNVTDFVFADPAGTLTAAGQRLGAPGPENLDGPLHNTAGGLSLPKADPAGSGVAPNFVYDPTPVANGTAGTITVRRLLVNNTGNSISRVRLRFVDLTTFPQPAGTADLRVLNSVNLTVETPPAQALGGGLDSTVAPPVVTFATPIANGASIPVDFVFGVMQTGCFRFVVAAEALPGGANTLFGFGGTAGAGAGCIPTAAPARISGQIVTSAGQPLAGVVMRLSGAPSATTVTDSNGSYRFNNAEVGSFYTVTPELANYSFAPEDRSFSLVGDKTDAVFTASANGTVTANAIDSAEYFVRQHYLDFLGREPEPAGLSYWSDQINQCQGDADCIRTRRLDISAAFFRSQEFQDTGSFVYRLYEGTLGRQLRYSEFSADRAQVIGGPNLEASKATFADAFVQRTEFAQRYQASTTAEAFVDAVLQTMNDAAGVNLASKRGALINRYHEGGSMNASRALVVRQLVDNATFASAVYNESFVTMEYFGYLRRSTDVDGYNFWLNVLNNSDPNNYRGMVCSFITSAEYQRRFGSVVTRNNTECGR